MLRSGVGFAAGGCSKGFEYVQHDAMTISQLRSLFQQQKQVRFPTSPVEILRCNAL